MPHKHTIRTYAAGHYYHIYNRGVEKRSIFLDKEDYVALLGILKTYLTPKPPFNPETIVTRTKYWRSRLEKNEVELLCYCLMPNHLHLLLKQNSPDGITKFMRRISTAYVYHFNQKYHRVGSLFQGKFKASLIDTDSYLLHLSRYIHRNPLDLTRHEEVRPLDQYPYSSYPNYLGTKNTPWVQTKTILNFFSGSQKPLNLRKTSTYKSFVEDFKPSQPLPENISLD